MAENEYVPPTIEEVGAEPNGIVALIGAAIVAVFVYDGVFLVNYAAAVNAGMIVNAVGTTNVAVTTNTPVTTNTSK